MTTHDERPAALCSAEAAATAWGETVRHQLHAAPRHADFYALAGDMVATLYALDDLTVLLSSQVASYGQGRALYDDTRRVAPADRLADAVECLHRVHNALGTSSVAANEFWSAVGHIGVEVAP